MVCNFVDKTLVTLATILLWWQAHSPEDAEDGMQFMQEMIDLSQHQQQEGETILSGLVWSGLVLSCLVRLDQVLLSWFWSGLVGLVLVLSCWVGSGLVLSGQVGSGLVWLGLVRLGLIC